MVYLMTIPHLDRDGLINGNPSVLHGKVCPLRTKLASRMPKIIEEWVDAELVIEYANGKSAVLWFKGFAKNNPLTHYSREKASLYPAPPGYVRGEKGLVAITEGKAPEPSGNPPDTSGKNPLRSEVEVEVDDQANAASGESSSPDEELPLSQKIHDRLQQEWMTVNISQLDNHIALAQRYGYAAWLAGFEACKRGQRSSHSYVEKAIISAIDRNPRLGKPKSKPKVDERIFYTDPVTGIKREVFM